MTFLLRAALPRDRDAAIDLVHALNRHEADLTGDRRRDRAGASAYYDELQDRLARREGRLVLAEADDAVVGLMGFCFEQDAAYMAEAVRRHGTITDLVVREDWRGHGIGQALLTEAERLTRAAGLKRLMIGVLTANEGAERLYRRAGFEPYVGILVKGLEERAGSA